MMDMMSRMSDKPSWEVKVFDNTITAKWKAEFLATPNMDVSEKMVDEVCNYLFMSLTLSNYRIEHCRAQT